MFAMDWENQELIKILKAGGVAVMPTDTLYGIVGSALNKDTVERIYALRKRNPEKPCIILISDPLELEKFSISLSQEQEQELAKFWPGPVSIVLDCEDENLSYLHRGTKTLAFRIPAISPLRELIKEVGPLIAPSANTEGGEPSKNVEEAQNYFGAGVDLYMDGGEVQGKPSKVIKLQKEGGAIILRE